MDAMPDWTGIINSTDAGPITLPGAPPAAPPAAANDTSQQPADTTRQPLTVKGVAAARDAGYSDRDIAVAVAKDKGLDLPAVLKAGYDYSDFVSALTAPEPEPVSEKEQPGITATAGHEFERQALPAVGGFAGFEAAAPVGARLGALAGAAIPGAGETGLSEAVGAGVGGLIAGTFGAFGGGALVEKAQKFVMDLIPDNIKEAIGQSDSQQQAEHLAHPYVQTAVDLATNLAFVRPGSVANNLREGATAFEKMMASPVGARLGGAGFMTGMEAGQEAIQDGEVDPKKLLIAAVVGALSNKKTALGEGIERGVQGLGSKIAPSTYHSASGEAAAKEQDDFENKINSPATPEAADQKIVGDIDAQPDIDSAINVAKDAAEGKTDEAPASPQTDKIAAKVDAIDDGVRAASQDKIKTLALNMNDGTAEQLPDGTVNYTPKGEDTPVAMRPWDMVTPAPDGSTVKTETAQNISDFFKKKHGVDVVWVEDPGKNIPFEGAVDPNQPNTIFLSNNPDRAVTGIVLHELGHLTENIVLPETKAADGTVIPSQTMGNVMNEVVFDNLNAPGWKDAMDIHASTAPKRDAVDGAGAPRYAPGVNGDIDHARDIAAHVVNEIAKDTLGEAPLHNGFTELVINKVADVVTERHGEEAAKTMMQQFMDGIKATMVKLRDLFFADNNTKTYAQNRFNNLDAVLNVAAEAYARRWVGDFERIGAKPVEVAPETQTPASRVLTPVAQDLLAKVDAGGVPGMMTNGLRAIAADHDIPVTRDTTPMDVVQALRDKVIDAAAPASGTPEDVAAKAAFVDNGTPPAVDNRDATHPLGQAYAEARTRAASYAQWIKDFDAQRREAAKTSEPVKVLQQAHGTILGKVGGDESRLTNKAASRLADIRAQLDAHLNPVGDSPDIARVREAMVAEHQKMADLASVSKLPPEKSGVLFSPRQDKEERLGSLDIHTLDVDRGKRVTSDATRLSQAEKDAIGAAAKKYGLPRSAIEEQVRGHKMANPVSAGWAPLVFDRLNPKMGKDGKVAVDKDGKPKVDYIYKEVPYAFQTGEDGKSLVKGTPAYEAKVAAIGDRMTDEVRHVFEAAKAGDTNAKNIIAQTGWYRVMRSRLRHEFGGFGDLFADLLGATSPNTPVRGNWNYAVEALRRATRGDYDALLPKWLDRLDAIKEKENSFRVWFNEKMAAGETKNAIYKNPEYEARYAELSKLREWPEDLLPTSQEGPKFGFNGGNVIRALVNLWRVVKPEEAEIGIGASKPKALNFSGNLIGFRSRATIDVWAARMLQRLSGEDRIPSMAEGGVNGDMLPSGDTTGQFGFGQDVFSDAVKKIRGDLAMSGHDALSKINDDDLQALVWFIEKAEWTKLDATSAAGEGGSFEFEANLAGEHDRAKIDELRSTIGSRADENNAKKALDAFVADPDSSPKLMRLHERLKAAIEARDKFLEEKTTAPEGSTKKPMATEQAKLLRGYVTAGERIEAIKKTISEFVPAETAALGKKLSDAKAVRAAAKQELQARVRTLDRYTAGLSQQTSEATQGVEHIPTNAEQASLANRMKTAIHSAGGAEKVVASRVLSTMGRYFDDKERALDLEIIARAGFDPSATQRQTIVEALRARQDSTFMSRVLRAEEEDKANPLIHRPGMEIYFRNADNIEKLEGLLEGMRDPAGKIAAWEAVRDATPEADKTEWLRDNPKPEGVNYYTVATDAKLGPTEDAGAMGKAVGIRFQYVPEFDARFGDMSLAAMSDEELAAHMEDKAEALAKLAEDIRQKFPEVTYSQQLWYATDVRFNHEFKGTIHGLDAEKSKESAGSSDGGAWQGRAIRDGLASADRQAREENGSHAESGDVSRGKPETGKVDQSPRVPPEVLRRIDERHGYETPPKVREGGDAEPVRETPPAPKPASEAPKLSRAESEPIGTLEEELTRAGLSGEIPAEETAALGAEETKALSVEISPETKARIENSARNLAVRYTEGDGKTIWRASNGEQTRALRNAPQMITVDKIVDNDPQRAILIAMGVEHPPKDTLATFFMFELERRAQAAGDKELENLLYTSRLNKAATEAGRVVQSFSTRDPLAANAIKATVERDRENAAVEAVKNTHGDLPTAKKAETAAADTEMKKAIKAQMTKRPPPLEDFKNLVNSLMCR